MLKKYSMIFAMMVLLVGTMIAQPMRVEGNDNLENGRMKRNHKMMGENNHHKASRAMNNDMNHRNGGHARKDGAPGGMILSMSEELELTTTQIENIKEIQVSFKKVDNTRRAEIENLLIDKRTAMQKEDFKKATKITKDISKIKEQISLSRITVMEDIHKELTETQINLVKTKCKMK